MIIFMSVSTKIDSEKVMVFKYGKMALIILVNGKMIKFKDKDDWSILKGTFMMEIGFKTKPTDLVFFTQNQVKFIKESGKTTFRMEKDKRYGQMVQSMRGIMSMV